MKQFLFFLSDLSITKFASISNKRSFMDLIVDRVRLSSNPTDDTTMDNGMQLCLVALGSELLYIKC